MLADGKFTDVLVLEVGVDLGLLSVVLLLEFEFSLVLVEVLFTLVLEGVALVDLVGDGGEVHVGVVELFLELAVLLFELLDVLFEIFNFLGLVEGDLEGDTRKSLYLVEGINDVITELVKCSDDFTEDTLIGEVLAHGQLDEGVDHGALLELAPLLLGDAVEGDLQLLDLEEGWVGEALDEGEGIINGGGGLVVLGDQGLVLFVGLFTEECVLSEGQSVVVDVIVDLGDVLVDLVSAWGEEVENEVLSAGNIGLGILDFLLEADDVAVVFVGAELELEVELLEGHIEVVHEFLDGVLEFLDGSVGVGVHLDEGEEGASPSALVELIDGLELGLRGTHVGGEDTGNEQYCDKSDLHIYFNLWHSVHQKRCYECRFFYRYVSIKLTIFWL